MAARSRILIPIVAIGASVLGPAAAPPLPAEDAGSSAPASESARWHDDARYTYYISLGGEAADRGRAQAEFRRGLELTREGRAEEAVASFLRAGETLPQIRDWAHAFAADAAALRGDTAAVRRLQAEVAPSLAQEWGWLAQVRARNRAGDPAGAAVLARELAARLEAAPRRAHAWQTAGELELLRGDTAAARAALLSAIEVSAGSEAALASARLLDSFADATPEERLAAGRVFLRHGNLDRGLRLLDQFLAAGAGTEAQRDAVRLEAGRTLYNARRYEQAEQRLRALLASEPGAAVAAEALLLTARAQLRSGEDARALATLRRLVARYESQPVAAEAHYLLGDLAQDAGDEAAARREFGRAIAIAPLSESGARSSMRLGALDFLHGRYETAAAVFEALRVQHPKGSRHQQASYWAGRSHAALGNDSLAAERYRQTRAIDPTTYYGMLASDRLGERLGVTGIARSPEMDGQTEQQIAGVVLRLDVLRSLELQQAATFEMQRVRRHFEGSSESLYALAEAFVDRGEIQSAVRLGRDLREQRSAWDPRLLRIVYPMPYRDQIVAAARATGLNPFLVAGLVRQESLFNPGARSVAGALGLMQVMPKTGAVLARRTGVRPFKAEQLRNPILNLRFGTLYLRDMIREQGGLVETLAAYNAGPTRVDRWRRFPEHRDTELFVERIPFEETRDYVRIVQQNARIYAALYGEHGLGD